jgi:hypothetical protein
MAMRGTIPFILSGALALSGCFFEGSSRRLDDGSLIVDWTVGGSKHPAACQDNAADSIDVVLRDGNDGVVDEFESACDNFALRVQVPPGSYTIDAIMLDRGGYPVTTAVIDHRYVGPGETGASAIDFPLDSFF